uniref:DNA-directed RNA polymerase III subunit RPC5 n=1 Tax=Heterorhabditis bacteriophora TaxID=37862 RepID=A0A1I7XR91_HETBA
MPARGRSSTSGRRITLPNLSLAGKREDKTLGPVSDANKKFDLPTIWNCRSDRASRGGVRGRGRGSARGGKARGTAKDKPALIESAGIFSEGLSGTDVRRVKHERDLAEMSNNDPCQTCDVTGWEEMWESDEEGDMAQLADLLRDGFISDYKRGSVLPLVLPKYDESQFIEIMNMNVKEELSNGSEDEKKEQEMDYKKKITSIRNFDELQRAVDEEANPTLKYSRKAADIFKHFDGDSSDNNLFLLQLPSVLNVLTEANYQTYVNGDINMSILPLDTVNYSSSSTSFLPRGRSIGKLQITRRGRVLLKVGGYIMDVAKTTPGGQQEGVMLLETCVQPDGVQASGLLHMRSLVREGKDAIYYLGPIRHHLTASLDWDDLKPHSDERNNENTSTSGTFTSPLKIKPMDVQRMREELLKIDKERMQWSIFAEQWATP